MLELAYDPRIPAHGLHNQAARRAGMLKRMSYLISEQELRDKLTEIFVQ